MTTALDIATMLTSCPSPGAPLPIPLENASAERARTRRSAAERKRNERARRRDAGMPDPRSVDSAIAQAVATILMQSSIPARIQRTKSMDGVAVCLKSVLGEAMTILVEGRNVPAAGARQALIDRLALAG
ncbi:hypothetical protein FV232_11115 [Methylobacterium sp. WL30]|uniref:hypothetical protein n=1 Tax=unclassified Methylobacterium TaxID=2615210 RepID=UPI0011C8784D|nr:MULTISPECIES: hypothetical protein [unclassified Methylobacterium]TXN41695.1 hypothetical protein FV225_01505 [Methylobacterium sp. WL93]TXN49121.1 hypothetical protein FV227_18175 [Methylobacterium sp. WL119]TXN67801.1 hypothetical protein FV232_11115 [Methylobacterium sp. WL30]TXN75982.1 hypothetical protein FV228_01745 [Methylobacterium sp. WL18]